VGVVSRVGMAEAVAVERADGAVAVAVAEGDRRP
jgi:hypothetical protein